MGLDISYYQNLQFDSPDSDNNDDKYDTGLIHLYKVVAVGDHVHLAYGGADRSDGLQTGWYKGERGGSFRAGSYSGYNEWRNHLSLCMLKLEASQVWESEPEGGSGRPFAELIHFSDCEGFIGPKTSAKLAADFSANKKKAQKYSEAQGEDWFYAKYKDWMAAFQCASSNGIVQFS